MSLITSISGIRGTIGGAVADGLSPIAIVRFTSAYARFISEGLPGKATIVVGRDGRVSGEMVRALVCATLQSMGCDVIDIGLASTPTTEIAVVSAHADGGIIITASHNPMHWNALKLLTRDGEFLSAEQGTRVLQYANDESFTYAPIDQLGHYTTADYTMEHVSQVVNLPLVTVEAIREQHYRVAVDVINSVGAIILPPLLDALGVEYTLLNGDCSGVFAHNPEPLAQHLQDIMTVVKEDDYALGIVVDPDVDRLAFISDDGTMFGEEYTLVSVADYVLSKSGGDTVSNLSSTRALRDVTERYGGHYYASAVGEVNVTTLMHKVGAVIGGEGNGGVIYPACHYGRDALVGIALFLSALAEKGVSVSALRASLPQYYMAKDKVSLSAEMDVDAMLSRVAQRYATEMVTTIDGVKIDFADGWVHLRKSNTEPILRIYSEASTLSRATSLTQEIIQQIS